MLGTAPTQRQSVIGAMLRAIYNCVMPIIQLLLSGGSTQALCRDYRGFLRDMPKVMQSHMEKQMEHEIETGFYLFVGDCR